MGVRGGPLSYWTDGGGAKDHCSAGASAARADAAGGASPARPRTVPAAVAGAGGRGGTKDPAALADGEGLTRGFPSSADALYAGEYDGRVPRRTAPPRGRPASRRRRAAPAR